MHMNFWWDYHLSDFIFQGLNVSSIAALACLCAALATVAFLLEWLKLLQVFQRQAEVREKVQQLRAVCPTAEDSTLLAGTSSETPPTVGSTDRSIKIRKRIKFVVLEVVLRLSIQVVGYGLMLTIMSFNGWMLVATVIGAGVGYFLFGTRFMKINIENCQTVQKTYCMINCIDPECLNGESTPAMQSSSSTIAVSNINEAHPNCHHSANGNK